MAVFNQEQLVLNELLNRDNDQSQTIGAYILTGSY